MSSAHRILIADKIHDDGLNWLSSQTGIEVIAQTGLDEENLCAHIVDCDGLIVRSKTKVTPKVIAAAKNLKVIGRAGIGVDNIDVPQATERGIVVFNTPDSNATTTAELALAHLFSLSRNLPAADRSVRSGEWKPAKFMGTELTGKTVGVIGFGTIGRIFARRCLALRMKVLVHDPFVTPETIREMGCEAADLDDLLARADFVSLHCPLMEQTRNLLDSHRLSQMKPGARVINCARGGLIDEDALFDALERGHLAGAALDVFANEPPKDSKLLTLANVVATPHLGASTEEAQQAVSLKIAENVVAFLANGATLNAINLPRLTGEQLALTRPYQELAQVLGRLVADLATGPISQLDIELSGRAAELDPRPITSQALVGLLGKRLATTVNQVNATALAQRQGMKVRDLRSETTDDYVSLIQLTATNSAGTTSVAGTLLGERKPRLVRVNGFDVEAIPTGHILITRHDDRPGVIGALGGILGRENINISRMQVGCETGQSDAIALVSISEPLPARTVDEIRALPAIHQVTQVTL